jgi:hypothetical protein
MKKISFKLLIAFVFAFFATLFEFLWRENTDLTTLLRSEVLKSSFLLYFCIGYVLLGNLIWAVSSKKNKAP